MAQFKPKEITSSKLDTIKVVTGQMILVSDTGDLYFDSAANGRIHVSSIVEFNSTEYNKLSDDDKLAFCKKYKNCLLISNGILYGYSNGEAVTFTAPYIDSFTNKLTNNTSYIYIPPIDSNKVGLKIYLNGILLMQNIDYKIYSVIDDAGSIIKYKVEFMNAIEASSNEPAYIYYDLLVNMGSIIISGISK